MIKLNLGAGDTDIPGYTPLDGKAGDSIYPLDHRDVDEIRASHVLEHFPHQMVQKVVADWVGSLKPGGKLRIAVPDFEIIARAYLEGQQIPVQGYVMGGQVDERDFHQSIFDREELTSLMRDCGLRSIKTWHSEAQDCAALPISLNLEGTKPAPLPDMKVSAVMSTPRLGFMDNFMCAFQALIPLKIPLRKTTGAFWGQCLERAMDEAISEGAEWLLTMDYDTIFTADHVRELMQLVTDYPEADAIAPIQANRGKATPLFTIKGPRGNIKQLPKDAMASDLLKVTTAHFGLTMIRVSALQDVPRPWFKGEPNSQTGLWDDGRTDDDIWFWRQWDQAGKSLYIANRIAVGHGEFMVRWPGQDMRPIYQHPTEFFESGPPAEVWQ